MKHKVLAEFVDLVTGERHFPAPAGAADVLFEPHDDEQRDRLIAAECLAGAPVSRSEQTDPLDHDGNGKPGGSLPGEQSTAARGRRRKGAAED